MVGASIIPKDSKVSYFVEVNFHVYSRNMRGDLGRFTMSMDQLSLGGGVRYVIAPLFVIQGQVGSVLLHNRKYNYRDAATLIEITWPSGAVQTLRDVPANQVLQVTEP